MNQANSVNVLTVIAPVDVFFAWYDEEADILFVASGYVIGFYREFCFLLDARGYVNQCVVVVL